MAGWWVSGNPEPQGSFTIMHVPGNPKAHFPKYPEGVLAWRAEVKRQSEDFLNPRHQPDGGIRPLEGPIDVFLRFAYEPKPHAPKVGPDIDKMVRGVLDALKGVAFKDDKQVVYLQATKGLASEQARPGMGPGVYITVQHHDEESFS